MNAFRAALRLGVRDAWRHRLRSLLTLALITLAVAPLAAYHTLTSARPPSREGALASIPVGAEARIVATAVPPELAPFEQIPEGAPGPWFDDLSQKPADASELARALDPRLRLLRYHVFPELIVAGDVGLRPGDARPATADVVLPQRAQLRVATYTEGSNEVLGLLTGRPDEVLAPDEAWVSDALAERLGVVAGATVTVVAPPFTGWYSTEGRAKEAVENQQKAFRVAGVVAHDEEQIWGPEGWASSRVERDDVGFVANYLAVGDAPVTWEQAKELNQLMAFAVSRHVLNNYPQPHELYPVRTTLRKAAIALFSGLVSAGLGGALALMLIAPAFMVGAEQSRRFLGMLSSCGATPGQLGQVFITQGLALGLLGGVLGTMVGVIGAWAASAWVYSDPINFAYLPWWVLFLSVAVSVLLGLLATGIAAWRVARLDPIGALKDIPVGSRSARRWVVFRGGASVALFAFSVAAAFGVINWPFDPLQDVGSGVASGTVPEPLQGALALLVLAFASSIVGALLLVSTLTSWAARAASGAPLVLRLALRDADEHRSRFVPAAAAVLVTTLLASYLAVMFGDVAQREWATGTALTVRPAWTIGPNTPVSDSFDRLILDDAAATLRSHGFDEMHDVLGVEAEIVRPATANCGGDTAVDYLSALNPGTPPKCVPQQIGFVPGIRFPSWLNYEVFAVEPEAMRVSGFAEAHEAARILELGGIVVGDATMIRPDGTVEVASGARRMSVPAIHVRGALPTVSSVTARQLDAQPRLLGMMVSGPYFPDWRGEEIHDLLRREHPLVFMGIGHERYPWGADSTLLALCVSLSLAVVAAGVSLALARTQTERELITMVGVGAPPSLARRFTVAQGLALVLLGGPLGMLLGLGLGALQSRWWARLSGDLGAVPLLLPVQAVILLALLAAVTAVALCAGLRRVPLVRRRLE